MVNGSPSGSSQMAALAVLPRNRRVPGGSGLHGYASAGRGVVTKS